MPPGTITYTAQSTGLSPMEISWDRKDYISWLGRAWKYHASWDVWRRAIYAGSASWAERFIARDRRRRLWGRLLYNAFHLGSNTGADIRMESIEKFSSKKCGWPRDSGSSHCSRSQEAAWCVERRGYVDQAAPNCNTSKHITLSIAWNRNTQEGISRRGYCISRTTEGIRLALYLETRLKKYASRYYRIKVGHGGRGIFSKNRVYWNTQMLVVWRSGADSKTLICPVLKVEETKKEAGPWAWRKRHHHMATPGWEKVVSQPARRRESGGADTNVFEVNRNRGKRRRKGNEVGVEAEKRPGRRKPASVELKRGKTPKSRTKLLRRGKAKMEKQRA